MIKLEYQKDATSPLVQFTSGQTMNQAQIVSVIRTFLEQCGFYKNKVNYSTPTPQEEWMPEHGQEEFKKKYFEKYDCEWVPTPKTECHYLCEILQELKRLNEKK